MSQNRVEERYRVFALMGIVERAPLTDKGSGNLFTPPELSRQAEARSMSP